MPQFQNHKKIFLQSFTIGFLPLIVYILVDEFYGLVPGILSAIGFGFLEFIYSLVKEKRIEYFVLFDVGLLTLLGAVSLVFHNDILIKLKPAFINIIFLILIYITVFTSRPILIEMSLRRIKGITFEEFQLESMKVVLKAFFYVFLVHTFLIIYAAFFWSKEVWGFVTGGLFYILAILVVLFEIGKRKWEAYKHFKKYRDDEWFDIVDEKGQIIGSAPRSLVHGNPRLMHPVVHLHILNHKGELFLQKRASYKQVEPNKWDTAVGGHVAKGESIERALLREMKEELGIGQIPYLPVLRYVWSTHFETELVHVFKAQYNGPFAINRKEISDGKFWKMQEIEKNLGKEIFTPNFENEYKMLKNLKLL